jgi:drug/metabolite transporter (DMT)-like permease
MAKSKLTSYIEAAAAVVLWGISYLWTNEILRQDVPVFIFIFFRMAFAALIMTVATLLLGKLQKIRKGDFWTFALLAFFEPFLYFIGESYGIRITGSPTTASVIIATIPVFTLLYGVLFFKEKLTALNVVGVLLSVGGIMLFSFKKGGMHVDYFYGVLFLLLAVISSVSYSIIGKKLSARYSSVTILTYQYLFGTLFFLIPFLTIGLPHWSNAFVTWSVIRPLLLLSVFASCVAYGLYLNMLRDLGLVRASVFTAVIPIFAAVGAFFLGQETFVWNQLVGMVFAVCGVAFAQIPSGRKIQK